MEGIQNHIFIILLFTSICAAVASFVIGIQAYHRGAKWLRIYLIFFGFYCMWELFALLTIYLKYNLPQIYTSIYIHTTIISSFGALAMLYMSIIFINDVLPIPFSRISTIVITIITVSIYITASYDYWNNIIPVFKQTGRLITTATGFTGNAFALLIGMYGLIVMIVYFGEIKDSAVRSFIKTCILAMIFSFAGFFFITKWTANAVYQSTDYQQSYVLMMILSVFSILTAFHSLKYIKGNHSLNREELLAKFSSEYDLSERELDVIKLVINGCSNDEIANDLEIAIPTVKTHLSSIFKKTGSQSRTEMVSIYFHGR